MLWLYLKDGSEPSAAEKRNIVRKGMRSDSSSCLPWLYLLKSKHVECVVSTKSNGAVTVHIAVTASGLGVRLYIDGKLSGAQRPNAQRPNARLRSNSDPFFIGQCPPGVERDFGGAQSYGFKGFLLDARFYLRRLDGESVERYAAKCKPAEKKKPALSRIKVSASKARATKLCARLLGEACAFNPALWMASMDAEVMELFEQSFGAAQTALLRSVAV